MDNSVSRGNFLYMNIGQPIPPSNITSELDQAVSPIFAQHI
jgi:hypothetical protein